MFLYLEPNPGTNILSAVTQSRGIVLIRGVLTC